MRAYLKKLRAEKALTMKKVGEEMRISESSYSLIENGERQNDMSLSVIQKLAAVFEVSAEEIMLLEAGYQAEQTQPPKAG